MKTLILLTAFLTASPIIPNSDPLMNLYLKQYLGVKTVPHKVTKKYFYRQIEFNTKFISSVVGPENLVTGMVNVDKNASPKKLKEKLVTMSHFTKKIYAMGYKVRKLQWVGEEDFKIHFYSRNRNMILYFKYNEKHKLFNVWMK